MNAPIKEMKLSEFPNVKFAVIDVDNTIIRTNIVELYLYMKRKRAVGLGGRLGYYFWLLYFAVFWVPLYLAVDMIDREAFQRLFYTRYGEFLSKELEVDAEEFFHRCLLRKMIKSTHNLIHELKGQGVSVVLLSTNIEPVVKQVAEYFDVPYQCLRIRGNMDKVEVDLSPLKDFKSRFISSFDPETTLAIADSKHDLPVLRHVTYPVIVADKKKKWMSQAGTKTIMISSAYLDSQSREDGAG